MADPIKVIMDHEFRWFRVDTKPVELQTRKKIREQQCGKVKIYWTEWETVPTVRETGA